MTIYQPLPEPGGPSVGDNRVVASINGTQFLVLVVKAGHRSSVSAKT
ncbi:MAG: hypothetical protein FWF25_09090 [Propionibacteriaceae bacterium]|nr:hypothetical protein [Propionibacteriaceae bacterium]